MPITALRTLKKETWLYWVKISLKTRIEPASTHTLVPAEIWLREQRGKGAGLRTNAVSSIASMYCPFTLKAISIITQNKDTYR